MNFKEPVKAAFCFDENIWMPAGVAITSLLLNSKGRCSYEIYCVVSKNVSDKEKAKLCSIVEKCDPSSTLAFIDANNDFDDARYEGFYVSSYFRLMLPALLPTLDRVIYLDSDIIVCKDLCELYSIDLKENLLAGVRDVLNYKESREGISSPLEYVNAGVLLFNLKQIREEKIYDAWTHAARTMTLKYFDQDILNLTCKNRIVHLPLKFNYFPRDKKHGYKKSLKFGIHTQKDVDVARKEPVIYHYIHIKPWNKPAYLSEIWWGYAKRTPFYKNLADNYIAGNFIDAAVKRDIKKYYFLGFLLVLTVEREIDKIRVKLFGIIPLLKIQLIKD